MVIKRKIKNYIKMGKKGVLNVSLQKNQLSIKDGNNGGNEGPKKSIRCTESK